MARTGGFRGSCDCFGRGELEGDEVGGGVPLSDEEAESWAEEDACAVDKWLLDAEAVVYRLA